MWIKLHAESIEAGFGKLPFEAFAAKLTGKIAAVILISLPADNDDPIDEPAPQEHAAQRIWKSLRIAESRPRPQTQDRSINKKNVNEQRGENEAERHVGSDSLE